MQFLISRASAGSGKTTTLVIRYLALALPKPESFGAILAITFTNKAAAEMKTRIVRFLTSVDDPNPAADTLAMVERLCRETTLSKSELCAASKTLLRLILHRYSDFSVCTIDSFFHSVVRSFARDLGLPWEFEVEVDYEYRLQRAVASAMETIGTGDPSEPFWVELARQRLEGKKSIPSIDYAALYHALKIFGNDEIIDWFRKIKFSVADLLAYQGSLRREFSNLQAEIAQACTDALILISSHGLQASDFSNGKNGIAGFFRKYQQPGVVFVEPNQHAVKAVANDKWFSPSAGSTAKNRIHQIKGSLAKYYHSIMARHQRFNLLGLMLERIPVVAVMSGIMAEFDDSRLEDRTVGINEFNRLLASVMNLEPVPYVYERVGERYRSFLIDEFQDTSVAQWQNLLPLLHNAVSEGGQVMIVGDSKQAIYRWRGGDAEQFTRLPDISSAHPLASEMELTFRRSARMEAPSENFRSRATIVEFNNELYGFASRMINHLGFYQGFRQDIPLRRPGGYINIRLIEKETFKEDYLLQLHHTIASVLERGYRLKDIAILTRRNAEAAEIADAIKKNFPIVTAESLHLDKSAPVQLLLALLRLRLNYDDVIARADLMQLTSEHTGTRTNFSACKKIRDFLDWFRVAGIDFSPRSIAQLPLFDLVTEGIRLFKLEPQAEAYIQHFMDAVLAFCATNPPDIGSFLEWWNSRTTPLSVVGPDDADAIHIQTIHKSKGLQFPVVVVPCATWPFSPDQKYAVIPTGHDKVQEMALSLTSKLEETQYANIYGEESTKSTIDALNLLYVATTRAIDELHVFAMESDLHKQPKNVSALVAQFTAGAPSRKRERRLYTWGEPTTPATASPQTSTVAIDTPLATPIPGRWIVKTHYQDIWGTERSRLRKYGIVLHGILALIKTAADIEPSIRSAVQQGLLVETESADVSRRLTEVTQHEKLRSHFADDVEVQTELEIVHHNEIIRLDRLVIVNNHATVIDYKTGRPDSSHIKQIQKYEAAVTAMGYAQVSALIVYLDPLEVIEAL